MKTDDEAHGSARIDGSSVRFDWPEGGETAREATLDRLRSLSSPSDPEPSQAGLSADEGLRSVDDELARLVYDSAFDAELLQTVRAGEGSARQLTFAARGVCLELEVLAGHLVGQLVPPQPAMVELRHRRGTTEVETDELGCFHIPVMPKGPVSFRFLPAAASAQSVATSWITL